MVPAAMPSTPLTDILQELNSLLTPERFEDYCPNGLQVPGSDQVSTVLTGVSAHLELFERAREERAELVLAHHGIFWGSGPPAGPIDLPLKRRLKLLFDHNISLAAYHLPLDAHPELGNNALLARALGAIELEPFALHHGQPIGFIATFPGEGLPAKELSARVHEATHREPLIFDAGPERVRRMGIVTGAGAGYLDEALAAHADAFLTGEPAERVMAQAREAGVHFIAAGHYATETFGVKRLGEHLRERFGVRHVFADIPNPI
jgi:dinuclear metal center YbgI/SA1388 family protein